MQVVPSHGRGPRFDPLCVHHETPIKQGVSDNPPKPHSASTGRTIRKHDGSIRAKSVRSDHATFFQNYCTCGGYARGMNNRPVEQPHMDWCPQHDEYADWFHNKEANYASVSGR